MDFFDYLFGKREDKSLNNENLSSNNKISERVKESKPVPPVRPSVFDPIEQYVKESVADLKKHTALSTNNLEPEAIYLASYLYLKGTYQIDFELDYFSGNLLDKIPSADYSVADKVFSYMIKYGEGYYGTEEAEYGSVAYKMNIKISSDYGSHIKTYFMRAHQLEYGQEFMVFKSPRNCLWVDGIKSCDSPTQREVYYKFSKNNFEFMIPPYNPLVTGTVYKVDDTTLRCESNDKRRTFIFHYDGTIKPELLNHIEMYRNDKGDMVSYHKD